MSEAVEKPRKWEVIEEFHERSDNVRRAFEEQLIDQDELVAMIDRFRHECDLKLREEQE